MQLTFRDYSRKVNIQRDVDLLLEEMEKSSQVVPIVAAALEILEAGLGDGAWNTPLHRACQMNHVSHVKTLLEAGCLPDAADIYGDTPLHMAVAYSNYQCIQHFANILEPEVLARTLATHNMYGQRPMDLAQDPMVRAELRKAILKIQRTLETPFMRIGLKRQEKVIATVFSRAGSDASVRFSRTPSTSGTEIPDRFVRASSQEKEGFAHSASKAPEGKHTIASSSADAGAAPAWHPLEEDEQRPDIGDVFFDALMHRPTRNYPTSITPFTGPPYAHKVEALDTCIGAVEKTEAKSNSRPHSPSARRD